MGIYAIKMPDIGEGIAEVEVVAWRVQVGDQVQEDQVVADVMTDKATVEVPSPVAGKVISHGGDTGQLMAVGAELIRLEVEGEGNLKEGPRDPAAVAAPVKPAAAKADMAAGTGSQLQVETNEPRPRADAHPSARSRPSIPPPLRPPGDKPIASPSVRHRAQQLGIELQFVLGSGPIGRIMHEDLDAYLASRGQSPAFGGSLRYVERQGEEAIPLIGLRRKIAQKMQESKRRIPHFSYVEEVDVTELEASRRQLNDRFANERGKLTLLPLIARAVVIALEQFPQMNARFDDDAGVVTRHSPVHLGVATQTDSGLMVPVLRHAEARDAWALGREIARLAEASRNGKATREELSGSTITISSLGALGGIVTTPVINHPEVAIIGVNRIVERAVLRGGAVVARQMMNLSSSFDHRVVDGMDAAEFVQAIRARLETPALLFVE